MATKPSFNAVSSEKLAAYDHDKLKAAQAVYHVSEYEEEKAVRQLGRQRLKYLAAACVVLVVVSAGFGLGLGLTRGNSDNKNTSTASKGSQNPAAGANTTTLSVDNLKFLPSSRDEAKDILRNVSTDEARSVLQLLDDVDKITPQVLNNFLEFIDSKMNLTARGVDLDYFKDQAYSALLWLRSRPELSGVMSLLRKWATDPSLNPLELAKAVDQVIGGFKIADFKRFLSWKADGDDKLDNTTLANMITLTDSEMDEPAQEEGEFGDGSSSKNSTRNLLQRSKAKLFEDPINQIETKQNPRGYINNPKALGFAWFKPVSIGIVFHVLLYHDSRGFLYPYNANSRGDQPGRSMIDVLNTAYKSTNIQFYLQEWRSNPKKPGQAYLNLGLLQAWQQCAADQEMCTCNLAKQYSVLSSKYINIFVVGSQMLANSMTSSIAYSTIIPSTSVDTCRKTMAWSVPTKTSQHLWISWDMMDPDASNCPEAFEDGAMTIAHELGHYMGLLHTHQGDCQNIDNVPDTPANMIIQDQSFYDDLARFCRSNWGKRLTLTPALRAQLQSYDSCKTQAYMDNVFNFMSYVHSSCYQLFTRGQVRLMQKTIKYAHQSFLPTAAATSRGLKSFE